MNQSFEHDIDRVQALLDSVKDVAPMGHPDPIAKENANQVHRELFGQYLSDLRRAKLEAEEWWEGIITTRMEYTHGDREEVIKAAKKYLPVAPADFTDVIGTIRRFWLECDALNKKIQRSERVPPEQFILEWLLDGEHDDLVSFLSKLTYLPIGLDQEGNWI